MNQREKQLFYAKTFIAFMDKLMDEGSMTRSEIATHLTVTLGRFIHDFIAPESRAQFAMTCSAALISAALDDDVPADSLH